MKIALIMVLVMSVSCYIGLGDIDALADSPFVVVTDDNYRKAVLDYEGPTLVLFYNSNFTRSPTSRLMLKVFEGLAEKLADKPLEKYGGKPIRFAVFDADTYNRLALTTQQKVERMRDKYEVRDFPVTSMYISGQKLDMLKGGPVAEKWISEWITFLGDKWISTNITTPNGEFYLRFGYSDRLNKVPR